LLMPASRRDSTLALASVNSFSARFFSFEQAMKTKNDPIRISPTHIRCL